jgi:rRNA-processing protein FCF1
LFLTQHPEYTLLTADKGLARDCEAEGVAVIGLPNPLPALEEVIRLVEKAG